MFTTIDKAIAAFISSLTFLAGALFGWDFNLGPELITAVGSVVTAFVTWLVPNKEPA